MRYLGFALYFTCTIVPFGKPLSGSRLLIGHAHHRIQRSGGVNTIENPSKPVPTDTDLGIRENWLRVCRSPKPSAAPNPQLKTAPFVATATVCDPATYRPACIHGPNQIKSIGSDVFFFFLSFVRADPFVDRTELNSPRHHKQRERFECIHFQLLSREAPHRSQHQNRHLALFVPVHPNL